MRAPTKRPIRRAMAGLGAAALILAACGSDDDSADELVWR